MSDLEHKISDTKYSLKWLIEIARELEAENARLREALEEIRATEHEQECGRNCRCPCVIASAALEGK